MFEDETLEQRRKRLKIKPLALEVRFYRDVLMSGGRRLSD